MSLSARLLVRVPPSLPKEVSAAARAEGVGRSEFTRRALAKALAERAGAARPPKAA